jgi:hypothetical protein
MEIRIPTSSKAATRHEIGPYKVCPGMKVLPIIRRNGFKGRFHGISPHTLFSKILTDKKAETLLKFRQYDVLRHYLKEDFNCDQIVKYWPSIRICIRNGYEIKDASIWIDYLEFLEFFGKDLRNSFYVCPENLKGSHDRYLKKKKQFDRQQKIEELKKKIAKEQKVFAKQKGKFFGLIISDGNIVVKPLESVEEFLLEGDELGHCIFEREYYKKPNSLILSARIKDKPIETIEVSLSRMTIEQARGAKNNPTKYHKRIVSLVQDNMHRISQIKNQKQVV